MAHKSTYIGIPRFGPGKGIGKGLARRPLKVGRSRRTTLKRKIG